MAWTNNWFGIRDKTQAIVGTITNTLGSWADQVKSTVGGAMDWLAEKLGMKSKQIKENVATEWEALSDELNGAFEDIKTGAEDTFNYLDTWARKVINNVGSATAKTSEMVMGAIEETSKAAEKMVETTRIHLTEAEKLFWKWGDWEREFAESVMEGFQKIRGEYKLPTEGISMTAASHLRALKKVAAQAPELLKQYIYPGSPYVTALKEVNINVDVKTDADPTEIANRIKEALKDFTYETAIQGGIVT